MLYKQYIYGAVAVSIVSVLGYVYSVFSERDNLKMEAKTTKEVIKTKDIEIVTTGIARDAKGQIKIIHMKELFNENTDIGEHNATF
jgi:hypothetical protein